MTPDRAIDIIREFMTNPYEPHNEWFMINLQDAFELAIEALENMEEVEYD